MAVSSKYLVKGFNCQFYSVWDRNIFVFHLLQGCTIVSVDPLNEMSKLAPFIVLLMTHQRGLIVKQLVFPFDPLC